MKRLSKLVVFSFIGVTLLAQDADKTPAQINVPATSDARLAAAINRFNKASSVIGMPVNDANGKSLGKVQDLVLDLQNNKLGYAVLSLSDKRIVPVPITALKRSENSDHFVLNMTPSLLAAAPGIQNDDWPPVDAFAVGKPGESEIGHGKSSDSR